MDHTHSHDSSPTTPAPAGADKAACDHTHTDGCCGHDHSHEGHSHEGHAHAHSHGPGFFFYMELAVLALWGVVLLAFMLNGRVIHFLSSAGVFREQAMVGGLILLVMAVFNFLMRKQSCDCGHDHGDGDAEGGHHHHHDNPGAVSRLVTCFILMAPLGYAWAAAPDSYSTELQAAMANSISSSTTSSAGSKMQDMRKNAPVGEYTLEVFRNQLGVAATGPIPLDVFMLWIQASDPTMRKLLEGQEVEVTGRVIKNTIGVHKNRLRMYDLQVTCCAADAKPISFPIEFAEGLPDYREMGWYKITGTITFEEERGSTSSVVKVQKLEPTRRPPGMGGAM